MLEAFPHARVEGVASFAAAEAFLTETRDRKDNLRLIVAGEDGDTSVREQFLSRVRSAFPQARLVLVARLEGSRQTCADRSLDTDDTLADVVRELVASGSREDDAAIEIIGDQWSPRSHQIKDFLCRHRVGYRWIDVEGDRRATRIGPAASIDTAKLPMVVFADGAQFANPTNDEIASKLGFDTNAAEDFYDLIIVGGGPAGLAAAVYAASEGVSTIIIERQAAGGQASTSSLIENYLGFPEGLSGAELASRAVKQAERFGTEILVTKEAVKLRREGVLRILEMNDGSTIAGRSIIIATGVRYNRLNVAGAERLHGAGIYYGAASAEAARYRGLEVCLLGGGNSAGQAAMLLARHAKKVRMIVFEDDFEERMSQYLAARLKSTPNLELMQSTTVTEVHGGDHLEGVTIENRRTGEKTKIETTGLFVAIGAKPHTGWLAESVQLDDDGFIVAGRDLTKKFGLEDWDLERFPFHLETNMPGVFAVGDVRRGSVKRIGSAVGEGAMSVQFVHEYLREV